MDDKSFNIRVPKKWARVAMIIMVTALIVAPLTAIASHSFTDVPDSNTFHEDIAWLADADVTKGCNPPANTQFCPNDEVTRGQMAAFLRRLAENQVVDADKVDGLDASAFVEEGEADSVTSAMTANEPGVAMESTDGSVALDGTLSPVVSVSLEAPSDGYVIVSADMQLNLNHTAGTTSQVVIGLSQNTGSFDQNHQDNAVGVPSGSATGFHFQSPGLTSVFPVTAGSVTIHLLGRSDIGSGHSVNDATLQASFVASAYGSVTTAGSDAGEDPAG
jgi:hypothetical protein